MGRIRLCLAAFFLAATLLPAASSEAQDRLVPTRIPWQPELTKNEEPALCAEALGATRQAHLSDSFVLASETFEWNEEAIQVRQMTAGELDRVADRETVVVPLGPYGLRNAELGNKAIVIYQTPYNWLRDHSVLLLVPLGFADTVPDGEWGRVRTLKNDPQSPVIGLARTYLDFGQGYAWPILVWDRRAFFVRSDKEERAMTYGMFRPITLDVIEITGDGPGQPVCTVLLRPVPPPEVLRAGRSWITWNAERLRFPSAWNLPLPVAKLVEDLVQIQGGTPVCPVSSSCSRAIGEIAFAEAVVFRLAQRPWVFDATLEQLEEQFSLKGFPNALSFLEHWSVAGVWQRHLRARFLGQIERAIEALREHYETEFGYSNAKAAELADVAVTVAVQAFVRGNNFYGGRRFQAQTFRTFNLRDGIASERRGGLTAAGVPIPAALLLDEDEEVLLKRYRRFRVDQEAGGQRGRFMDPIASYALDRPALLEQLVEEGLDIHETNIFGKTALMFAAQLNLREAASLLLRQGADPNAATNGRDTYLLKRDGRTALLYAAENAGDAMIKLLLAAGADPRHRDSRRNSVLAYLDHNEKVDAAERARMRARLVDAGATP